MKGFISPETQRWGVSSSHKHRIQVFDIVLIIIDCAPLINRTFFLLLDLPLWIFTDTPINFTIKFDIAYLLRHDVKPWCRHCLADFTIFLLFLLILKCFVWSFLLFLKLVSDNLQEWCDSHLLALYQIHVEVIKCRIFIFFIAREIPLLIFQNQGIRFGRLRWDLCLVFRKLMFHGFQSFLMRRLTWRDKISTCIEYRSHGAYLPWMGLL